VVDLENVEQLFDLTSSSFDHLLLLIPAHEAINSLVAQPSTSDPTEGLACHTLSPQ
jgi:hypothetical protein